MALSKYCECTLIKYIVLIMMVTTAGGYITDPDQCVTANNRPGVCTELTKCSPIIALATSGGRPMPKFIRTKLHEEHCGFNGSIPKICCPPIVYDSNGERLNPYTTPVRSDVVPPPNVLRHPNYNLLPRNCGEMDEDRIDSGSIASILAYPWKALIAYNHNGVVKFHCGGTIISEYYILTAAHCLSNLDNGIYVAGVRVGESDIDTTYDCEGLLSQKLCNPKHVDYHVAETFVHSDYDPWTRENNIGLIRLGNKINFSIESSRPVCLPSTPTLAIQNFEGMNMRISGWGLNLVSEYHSSKYKHANTPIINSNVCANMYNRTPIIITHKTMCAGRDGASDSCNSDSGGSLLAPSVVRDSYVSFVQYGIVSVGPTMCGVAGTPSIYTRVGYFMDWILDRMRP